MKKRVDHAIESFQHTFSCSQAVLSTFGPDLGLERKLALRVAGAFGGGMARMGETCGAVTGALMVIGLKWGKTEAQDDKAKEKTYEYARQFVNRFLQKHGSITCRELLTFDIGTPEGQKRFKEENCLAARCTAFVRDAVSILEQILNE